jgi:aldehyde dehydrogenase (NAD+)
LTEQADVLAEALAQDLGKSRDEAKRHEIDFAVREVDVLLDGLTDWLASRELVELPPTLRPAEAWTEYHPLGEVLVIAPWNFPLQLVTVPLAGALAAGNAVVVKPSEVSSAVAGALGQLIPRYLDQEAVAVVQGGVAETTKLLRHRFD